MRNGADASPDDKRNTGLTAGAALLPGTDIMTEWLAETLYPDWGQRFRVLNVLARETSAFQDIVVFESVSHGRVLMLDGCVQITEADEFVYQEMIVHVPLLAHGAAKRVLVIGAGDGGVLRRVLQHGTVETVVMVEIDEAVIRLAKQFMPGIAAEAWDDPRATVIVGDGIKHVAEATSGSYDVIIVDSTDPIGVGEGLFSAAFYADCARVLGPFGIVVNQCGVPFMQPAELRETNKRRLASFPNATAFVAAVPTYVGGLMTLGFAAKKAASAAVPPTVLQERARIAGILDTTRYWTPEVQAASFCLPPYIAQYLVG